MRAVVVVSPHLDDGCLGAGQFIAGRPDCVMTTVFAGTPDAKSVLTAYDQKCGFGSAAEAVEARRAEDTEAMSVLQARAVHLDFVDSQYGGILDTEALVEQLRDEIRATDPELVIGPLGLVHRDHQAVREALLEATRDGVRPVWLYEELPYRVVTPEAAMDVLDSLRERGYEPELGFIGTGSVAKKMDALWSYRSQLGLPEFANRHELLVGERFWRVTRPEGEA